LTDEEIFKVSEYLVAQMSIVNKQAVMYYEFGWAAEPTDDIQDIADIYFGGTFARSWYLQNKYWMDPTLVEIMDREIAAKPVSDKWQYAEKLRPHFSSPESGEVAQQPLHVSAYWFGQLRGVCIGPSLSVTQL